MEKIELTSGKALEVIEKYQKLGLSIHGWMSSSFGETDATFYATIDSDYKRINWSDTQALDIGFVKTAKGIAIDLNTHGSSKHSTFNDSTKFRLICDFIDEYAKIDFSMEPQFIEYIMVLKKQKALEEEKKKAEKDLEAKIAELNAEMEKLKGDQK
jgi:hypothetical protein